MAYIQEIEADQAEGDLKAVYDEMIEQWSGRLPPVLKVVGLHPQALKRLKDFNLSVTFGGSTLGRRREEIIATSISAWNDCTY